MHGQRSALGIMTKALNHTCFLAPTMSPDKGQKIKRRCCEICMLAFKQMKNAMQFLVCHFNIEITEVSL